MASSPLSILALVLSFDGASGLFFRQNPCNPIDTVNNGTFTLDLEEYTRATWYVQKQQVNAYQPATELYCVTATYNLENGKVPLFGGPVISVYNRATKENMNDQINGGVLCARIADASEPDKFSVAPCFLPNIFAGPYWPIYLETNANGEYTIVVVSGGQPDVVLSENPTICTTKERGINNSGLWILARDPEADPAAIARAEAAMLSMGVGTSELVDVPQGTQCQNAYDSRFIKPRDCSDPGKCNPASGAGACDAAAGPIRKLFCILFRTFFYSCI
mmetsp:Transcript_16252/g.49492  ORF Transcript_16252/g.49492 Transcript_16252/m.49492 type:complete len:276 (-) Transcript_16252:510-1337(-)